MDNLNSNEYYSIRKMVNLKVFPWLKSYHSYKAWIKKDTQLFNAIVLGEKTATRYFIKGENILAIQQKAKEGKLTN